MSAMDDEKAKKAAKKEKLRAEAEQRGISYEALKAEKKEKKEKKKRKREADKLTEDNADYDNDGKAREQEQKRMRTWSGDFDADKKDGGDEAPVTKRLRTRSMDKAEENAKMVEVEKSQSTEEWRKSHNITLRGYGKNATATFADPFIEFADAPFNPTLQKTLKDAGFERPSFIQAQVSGWICIICILFDTSLLTHYISSHIMFTGLADCYQRYRHDLDCKNWIWKDMRFPPALLPPVHPKQRAAQRQGADDARPRAHSRARLPNIGRDPKVRSALRHTERVLLRRLPQVPANRRAGTGRGVRHRHARPH